MTQKKIRLYKFASENNLSINSLMGFLQKKGYEVKSLMTILTDPMINDIQDYFNKDIEKAKKHYRKIEEFQKRRGDHIESLQDIPMNILLNRINNVDPKEINLFFKFAQFLNVPSAYLNEFFRRNNLQWTNYSSELDERLFSFVKNNLNDLEIFLQEYNISLMKSPYEEVFWGFIDKTTLSPTSIKYKRFIPRDSSLRSKNINITPEYSKELINYFGDGRYIGCRVTKPIERISSSSNGLDLLPMKVYQDYLDELKLLNGNAINEYSYTITKDSDLLTFANVINQQIIHYLNNPNLKPLENLEESLIPNNSGLLTSEENPDSQAIEKDVPQEQFSNEEINKLKKIKNYLQEELNRLKKEVVEEQNKSLTITSKINVLNQSLINLTAEIDTLTKEKTSLVSSYSGLKVEMNELIDAFNKLKNIPSAESISAIISLFSHNNNHSSISFIPYVKIEETISKDVLNELGELNDKFDSLEQAYKSSFDIVEFRNILSGCIYDESVLTQVDKSVESDRLTILCGQPGFGKSKLFEKYVLYKNSKIINNETILHNTYAFISVKPEWIDPSYILGSINYLSGEPEISDFVRILYLAERFQNIKFFVLFDEFNIARPENYFAPLLSIRELPSGHPKRKLKVWSKNFINSDRDYEITIGNNLYFMATINEDSSTVELSPKVRDRSDIIFLDPDKELFDKFLKEKKLDRSSIICKISDIWWKIYNTPPFSYRLIESITKVAGREPSDSDLAFRLFNNLPHQNDVEKFKNFYSEVKKTINGNYKQTRYVLDKYLVKISF